MVVIILLLRHAYITLSAHNVNSTMLRIKHNFIRASRRRKIGDGLSRCGIEDHQHAGAAADYKQAVIGFIQSDWRILPAFMNGATVNNPTLTLVNHPDEVVNHALDQ